MPLPLFTGATNTVQLLADRPNQTDGLTPAQLKLKFDQHAINYETYSNDTLVPAINVELQNKTDNLTTHKASTDHDGRYYTELEIDDKVALLATKSEIYNVVLGQIPPGSITDEQLSNEPGMIKSQLAEKSNVIASYGAQLDPNTTAEDYIISQHANNPLAGSFFHIKTFFYTDRVSNRAQLAIKYNSGDDMYIRQCVNSVWTAWVRMLKASELATSAEVTTGTDTTKLVTPKTLKDQGNFNQTNYDKVISKATSATLALTDNWSFITMTSASSQTITIPTNASVAFPIGSTITFKMDGAGAVVFAPSAGVTLDSKDTKRTIDGANAWATLKKDGTDTWSLAGALK